MTSTTFSEALTRAGVTVPDETIADLTVPVLTVAQRQGDVGVFPRRNALTAAERKAMTPVPAEGIAVVRGEATGNTHLLMVDSGTGVTFAPKDSGTLIGVVDVPEGAVAHLIHTDEHGVNAIGPGCYELRGKQEQADIVRRVQD